MAPYQKESATNYDSDRQLSSDLSQSEVLQPEGANTKECELSGEDKKSHATVVDKLRLHFKRNFEEDVQMAN